MPEPDERDEIAGVLAEVAREHPIECTSRYEGYTCRGCRDRGWMSPFDYRRHVAEAQATHLATILAERDRQTAARAWDEGFDAGERDVFEHDRTSYDTPCIPNPYRDSPAVGRGGDEET